MTDTAPATATQGASLLQLLKDDLLVTFAQPLETLLVGINANPTPLGIAGAWIAFNGQLLAALPSGEAALIKEINGVILAKVQAAVAAAQAQLGA